MPHVTFHPGYSGGWMFAVGAAALVLIGVFYRRAFRTLKRNTWLMLYALRAAAVMLVLLLLFRPVFSFQREVQERRAVVFLLDNSQSMGLSDEAGGGTRLEHARTKLWEWISTLKRDFDVYLFNFSETASSCEKPEDLLQLKADGSATSLSRALATGARAVDPAKTEALLLLSDGLHNSAGSPLKAASEIAVPVHTIGVGTSLRERGSYRDVRLADLECPDQMALQNRAQIKASLDAIGYPGRVVTINLLEDDQPIAEQQLALDDVEGLQSVTFDFLPATKGIHTYTARVQPAGDEKIAENNQRSRSALVVDSRIRVLFLEGTLRSEYGALVGRFLSKDPNLEFCALVQTRPNVFTQRSNIADLNLTRIPTEPEQYKQFDVFLLGDLDRTYFQDQQLELLRERVREGAGLLMMGGYHSLGPGGFSGTALDDVLPVVVGPREIGQVVEPFLPVLTPDGRQHPVFANIQTFFPSLNHEAEVAGLPPLEGCTRVAGLGPGATALALHPTELLDGKPMPVMAVQTVGKGRAAAFTADTTRNWQQALRSQDRESPFLRFWGQTIRWLAGRTDEVSTEAGVSATTDKAYYEPESPVTISAVVRGKEGEAAERATVKGELRLPDGRSQQLDLAAVSGPAGNFRAEYTPAISGRYELIVKADADGLALQSDKLAFDVGRPNLEFDRVDLDEKTLTEIARQTGGQYSHLTTADRLIERLQRKQERRQVEYEVALAWPPLLWALFAGVLTVEWLLRRSYQLR